MDRENPFKYITSCVEASGYELDHRCYQTIRKLFVDRFAARSEELGKYTAELEKPEFLACVDNKGATLATHSDIVDDFLNTLEHYPAFGQWFRDAETGKNGARVLLVSRWLCHLVGFRHLSVHLFIDLSNSEDLTLVQVRSAKKAKSPGCFDLPVSGHRANQDSIEKTLATELKEEAGFQVSDLGRLAAIGEYEFSAESSSTDFPDNEYRVVYRCHLKEDKRLHSLRIEEGEVAAISIFSISELRLMMATFPERMASGLTASFRFYN